MVSLTRQGLDYEFFQLLSGRIDQAEGEQREKLLRLREKLLEITRAVDQQLEARTNEARKFLEELLTAPDVTEATRQNIGALDEFFMRMLDEEMQAARKAADLERISKLQKIVNVLEEASQPTAELQLIEQLLAAENETALEKLLQENQAVIADPQFMETLTALVAQLDSSEDQPAELKERIQQVFEAVLRFSMKTKM
jgi:type I site-specific restriction-modification system R (restriction) subunit